MIKGGAESKRPGIALAVRPEDRPWFFPEEIRRALDGLGRVTALETYDSLPAALDDAVVLISGWGCPALTPDLLQAAPRLGLLAHTGASVKPFVTDASWQRGIRVTQAGAAMAAAVADSALTMTLMLLQRLPRADHALHTGRDWAAARTFPPRREITAVRVGVIGASRTGRLYIQRVQALGGRVQVYDPYLDAETAGGLGVTRSGLTELLSSSDVVAVHAPATPETHHLLGRDQLALMPDGGLLVNTARARLVDTEALIAELRTGRLDAALDVYDEEPLPTDSPLRGLRNVLLSPHVAGNTVESRARAGHIVVDEIRRFLNGSPLKHEITPDMLAIMG